MDLDKAMETEFKTIFSKVYPVSAPEGTKPDYCTYNLGSNIRNQNLNGHDGLLGSQYQIDYYQTTFTGLKLLKNSVITLLKGFNQRILAVTGPFIQQCEIINDFETYESNVKQYKGVIEINIYYEEN